MFPSSHAEYYYSTHGQDVDPKSLTVDEILKVNVKNSIIQSADCDLMISPTSWQASTYPREFKSKIKVIHDGIDINAVSKNVSLDLDSSLIDLPISSGRPLIVYTNRALEPIRGSSVFAEALPRILSLPQKPIVCIVGGQQNQNPYGGVNKKYQDTRARLKSLIDSNPSDIFHFPRLPHCALHQIWNLSSCNLYLTSPFVLSWSLLEMMCISTPIVASSTPPVLDYLDKSSIL